MPPSSFSVSDLLRQYGPVLARKMGYIAVAWIAVYFISQPCRKEDGLNVLMLFAPLIGAIAGVVAGWYIATNAVEDSSLHGIVLWVILVLACVLPMWICDALLRLITGWQLHFGGFMVLTTASLLGLASSVWIAATQE